MKTLNLNNGYKIPVVGLGTYELKSGEISTIIENAIDAGYRHFDCAWFYGNEKEIGKGLTTKLNDSTVKREELFITSKLWNNFHSKAQVLPMLKTTLSDLNLDYLDLYLIHWPTGFKEDADKWPVGKGPAAYSDVDYLETWEAMEECVKQGLTRSIGISNFNSQQISRLLGIANIKPTINQIEVNPSINQKKLIEFCRKNGIVVTGYCPLRKGNTSVSSLPSSTIPDTKIKEIAEKYKKTPAQVILNYLVGLGIVVVPKSSTKSRLVENIDIFDFELDKEDKNYLDSVNQNKRICSFKEFADHKYYPFNIEF